MVIGLTASVIGLEALSEANHRRYYLNYSKQSLYPIRKKLLIFLISITFFFCAVIFRVGFIQLADGGRLQVRAVSQWTRDLPLKASRGAIKDRNGVVLADTSTLYTLYVRPRAVKSVEDLCRRISPILDVRYEKLYKKIAGKVVSEITVAKKITKDKMLEIYEMDISGIYFSEDTLRYYPYGNFLTQVLGYTNVDGEGQEGLESFMNKYLAGVDGELLTQTDLTGIELSGDQVSFVPAIDGFDLSLTVDSYIQRFCEDAIYDAISEHNAVSASCIVMNAQTGAILAMANAPGFDLNSPPRQDVGLLYENMKNRTVTDVYEPGSTFKILTTAIALNEGKVSENSTFYDPGYRIVDGQRIKCWKTTGHGSQTFGEGVMNSCNSVFMDLALSVGVEKMYDYYQSFGLTTKTGIDLRGEGKGILLPESSVKNVDLARMGFGHAIAVTPIQLLTAACACVNGGKLMTPYICDKIVDSSGKIVFKAIPEMKRRVVSEETSKVVAKLLESVVSEGSGKHAYVDGYRIGGKTGTAQKYKNGTIAQGAYVSSFLGFAPVDNPQYAILLTVNEPRGGVYYGSLVAAPYVGQIFSNIFQKFNVEKDQSVMDESYYEYFEMPDLVGKSYAEASVLLRKCGLVFECDGTGVVERQLPVAGSMINKYVVAYIKCA